MKAFEFLCVSGERHVKWLSEQVYVVMFSYVTLDHKTSHK